VGLNNDEYTRASIQAHDDVRVCMQTHYGDDVQNGWVYGGYYVGDLPGASMEAKYDAYGELITKLKEDKLHESMRFKTDEIRKEYDIKVSIPLGPEMAERGR
jgi:hypothetical protein